MNKNKVKPYRISISFPHDMADIIWAYAEDDERPFKWEVVHMIKELFEERQKALGYSSGIIREERERHHRMMQHAIERKEDVQS